MTPANTKVVATLFLPGGSLLADETPISSPTIVDEIAVVGVVVAVGDAVDVVVAVGAVVVVDEEGAAITSIRSTDAVGLSDETRSVHSPGDGGVIVAP